jgi:cyclophilin family peptidyl-prolyl cis-trans isomerase
MAAYFFMKGKKMKKNPMVTMKMENGKLITVELFPEIAPNTVNNFISLINKRFYNGLIFHRVISGFMIQGGCPKGMGHGGPDYCIWHVADNRIVQVRNFLSCIRIARI